MLVRARGKACSANSREQALPCSVAIRVTNRSAFLSPQSSSQGSQVQRAMTDSFFLIPQRPVQFENTESTSHLAQTEAHPWGLLGPGSRQGWQEQHPGQGRHSLWPQLRGSAPVFRRFSFQSALPLRHPPGAAFSTLGFNFPLCLGTRRRAGLGVSMNPMSLGVGGRSLRSPAPGEGTGKVNFTKGSCIFQGRGRFQTNFLTSQICMRR